jgi:hypothetical protein
MRSCRGWFRFLHFTLHPGRTKVNHSKAGRGKRRKNGLKLAEFTTRSEQMGSAPVFFHAIHLDMPVQAVYRRMGYRRGLTKITPEQQEEIRITMDHAETLIELKGSAFVLPIDSIDGGKITLGSGVMLRSTGVAGMLKGSREVLFMGATAGGRIMEEIRHETDAGNLTRAVVLDAAASEMTDKALEWIAGYMGPGLRRRGKELSAKRFSAGYGDFALENQKIMYDNLKLWEIGVQITESCILVPEKSVTALAGISTATD